MTLLAVWLIVAGLLPLLRVEIPHSGRSWGCSPSLRAC